MTAKTTARPKSYALRNRRGKRIRLSDAELRAMQLRYPENTETMPNALPQQPFLLYLITALKLHFDAVGQSAAVLGDVFIFYREGDTQAKFAADLSVTIGIDFDDVRHDINYYSWLLGALPGLVMECGSRSTAQNDLRWKVRLYAELGIPEYWLLDVPFGENYGFLFRGYRLVDGEYVEITPEPDSPAGMIHYRSQVMDLDFCIPEGATELVYGDLRVYDPEAGEYLRTSEETEAEREDAIQRAELEYNLRIDAERRAAAAAERAAAANQRAEAEREARLEDQARIRELEEQLRQQGRG